MTTRAQRLQPNSPPIPAYPFRAGDAATLHTAPHLWHLDRLSLTDCDRILAALEPGDEITVFLARNLIHATITELATYTARTEHPDGSFTRDEFHCVYGQQPDDTRRIFTSHALHTFARLVATTPQARKGE